MGLCSSLVDCRAEHGSVEGLMTAIQATYTDAQDAYGVLLDLVEEVKIRERERERADEDDWTQWEIEPGLITYLRWEFFDALKSTETLTLGELALGVALYDPLARNVEFELDCESETLNGEDPYNMIPRLCLERFPTADPQEQLLLAGLIDAVVGVWLDELHDDVERSDGSLFSLLRHDTVEEIKEALCRMRDLLCLIVRPDQEAHTFTRNLRRFAAKHKEWDPLFAQSFHNSETLPV